MSESIAQPGIKIAGEIACSPLWSRDTTCDAN
jgi:hypothetical protein